MPIKNSAYPEVSQICHNHELHISTLPGFGLGFCPGNGSGFGLGFVIVDIAVVATSAHKPS